MKKLKWSVALLAGVAAGCGLEGAGTGDCTSNCQIAGDYLCSSGTAQQCYRTADGCLQYAPPTSCQGGLVCNESVGCTACTSSMECDTTEVCGADQRCAAPWGEKFDFVIVSAVVAHRDGAGALWDPNGIPDPKIILFANGSELGRTSFKQDTETPVWNEKITGVIHQGDQLSFVFYDKDISSDDIMDGATFSDVLSLLKAGGYSGTLYPGSPTSLVFTVVPHPM
jgi:hypothetical protein